MQKALVSVIVPVFNRVSSIEATLRSVQSQTCPDWEAIVVDDGSTDGTSDKIVHLAKEDVRIRLRKHHRNYGGQAARNTGIRSSHAKWVAFLDSDDLWLPDSLDIRLKAADKNRVDVVHSECYALYADGDKSLFGIPPMEGWVYPELLSRPGPAFPSLLVVREALERIGGFDERIIAYQEWDTAIRLARHYRFGFVAAPTFIYDCRGTEAISRDKRRNAMGYEQVVRKHFSRILRYSGPRAISHHYQVLATSYHNAGERSAALRSCLVSALWWPFHPLRSAGQLRNILAHSLYS